MARGTAELPTTDGRASLRSLLLEAAPADVGERQGLTPWAITAGRAAIGRAVSAGSGVLLIAAALGLWEVSARAGWAPSSNWPAFSSVVAAFWRGLISGEMPAIFAQTLTLLTVGYVIGCAAGVLAGLAIGFSQLLNRFLAPIIEILRPVPVTAIIPPLILFLGVDSALKIFVIAFCSFFPVTVNTASGVRDVNQVVRQTARTFRLSQTATLVKIILPGALPAIFAGLRISLGIAFAVTIIAEMIAGSTGVGYFIVQTQYSMQPAAMYAAIIVLAVVGYALNTAIVAVERRVIPWYGMV